MLYSPDAFGHPAALPAIAAEFGIRRAVIRRGLGRPGDFYRWESPGGESLLVHHLPPAGYDFAIDLAGTGADLGRVWRRIRQELTDRASTSHLAVFLGADHHPMVPGLAGLARRLRALEPGHQVRVSGLGEYFDAVEPELAHPPLLRGALRSSQGLTWDLQDVHSSRSRLKRRHGEAELRLTRFAEPLDRLAREHGGIDQEPVLSHAWRTLLQCQFHDTLAGTTCDEAQREQALRLAAVDRESRLLARAAVDTLLGEAEAPGDLALWNPATRPRTGIVTARLSFFRRDVPVGPSPVRGRAGPGFRPVALATPAGRRIPLQMLTVRPGSERRDDPRRYPDHDEVDQAWVAFEAPVIPGLGLLRLEPTPSNAKPVGPALAIEPATLENRSVTVQCAPAGTLTLTDAASGVSLPGLLRLVDQADQGDLYTFSGEGEPEPGSVAPLAQAVLARGPLLGAVETRWTARFRSGGVAARSLVVIDRDSPLVRLRLELDQRACNHRLRLRFAVGPGHLRAGSTAGLDEVAPPVAVEPVVVERSTPTRPAQRYVSASGKKATLVVLAPGFFEYEWTRGGDLLITAFRAVGELSKGELPERPGHAAWPISTPEAQEPGLHTLEFALAILPPGNGEGLLPHLLEEMWEEAFVPMQPFWRRV